MPGEASACMLLPCSPARASPARPAALPQTLRMMGTYEGDYAAARQSGSFIPHVCPGGLPWFHPDVAMRGERAGPGTLTDAMLQPYTAMGIARA